VTSEDITPSPPHGAWTVEDRQKIEQEVREAAKPRPSRVCIVGFADGHRHLAPWDADDMEFWGINRLHTVFPDKRFDRWFEIHDLERFYGNDQEHQTWLKESRIPVYVRPQDLPLARQWGIETAEAYPVTEVVGSFGPYFTNTISWLLALAIVAGFQEIQIFGVDMAQDSLAHAEYSEQRPSCEWLIGVAQGRGISVVIPDGSDLLKASHLYGFDDEQYRNKLMSRLGELGTRKEQVRAQMSEAQSKAQWMQSRLSELDGAMQEVQYNIRNLVTPSAEPFKLPAGETTGGA
jgi:hypothetical protein